MMQQIFLYMRQEIMLGVILLVLLVFKIAFSGVHRRTLLILVNCLLCINFCLGFWPLVEGSLFDQMFHTDRLIQMEKNILNLGTLILSLQAYPWLLQHDNAEEFYVLLLSALLGMFFMISSRNFLMFYLSLELSTLPLAALSNFDLEKRKSSEAALKFIISSAFSSGLLLLGLSLLYGVAGTLDYGPIAGKLDGNPLLLFTLILIFAGFAFKISVVPFHLWTADVYEGAPVVVTAYLSVVSKASILFVLMPALYVVFKPMAADWYRILYFLSILTMVIGNLFAIRQENLKRLLAFSSISQIGFMLIGISGSSREGFASVLYFVLIYLFSNLAAFGVISIVSVYSGKENLENFRGLYKTNPFLSWTLAIAVFSLAGIPPTAGFFGKFFLLMAGAGKGNFILVGIAAANMVLSLYYYLRIVKALFMEESSDPVGSLSVPWLPKIALFICTAGILIIGLTGEVYDYIYSLSRPF